MDGLEQRIADTVRRLDEAVRSVSRIKGWNHDPKPRPPATEQEILDYETFVGVRLPASYRAFLRLHNGYDWLALHGHVLPLHELMPGGKEYDYITRWKRQSAKYGGGEVLDAIVVAELGEPSNYIYFEPKKRRDDEMVVVRSDPESSTEFNDLLDYFEQTIRSCEEIINRGS